LGGDEFIILIQNISDSKHVQSIAESILKEFTKEFEIDGSTLHVSVSIGIAMYPEHGTTLDKLLRYADIAMYKVKENGKTNYLLYDNEMKELFVERVNIEKYLPKAIENNEFILFYQPQYDIKQNKVTGFEALLRWKSPELGEVSPLKFIKIAEDSRLIVGLGKWVLQSACDFIKRIHAMGFSDMVISVNISIIQLMQKDFCDMIYETLKQCQLDAKYLELEITETILIESIDKIGEDLKKLSEMNVKIALDDFGKGYSSLNYLRQLPISTLKVDKAFIDGINGQTANTLAGNIVILGKSLRMNIVAEGVETKEQLEYLKQYDCDKFQGYLFSRPKPEEEIVKLLQEAYVLA
jgi:predicted signal transduction protein with EAL and GGDEF domain